MSHLTAFKVLVVDDDPMVLHVNKFFVDSVEGFKVIGTARNGGDAVEAVERLRPDLILLDVYMPNMDGLQALRELRAQGIPSDVILVSAAHDPATVEAALRAGAHDYVIKPFRPERLQAALESYRNIKRRFKSKVRLSQAELDRVLQVPAVRPGQDCPQGLSEATLQQVTGYLKQQDVPRTATEVADALGMSRVTARRYLDHLAKAGKAKIELQYGSGGRPLNRYSAEKP